MLRRWPTCSDWCRVWNHIHELWGSSPKSSCNSNLIFFLTKNETKTKTKQIRSKKTKTKAKKEKSTYGEKYQKTPLRVSNKCGKDLVHNMNEGKAATRSVMSPTKNFAESDIIWLLWIIWQRVKTSYTEKKKEVKWQVVQLSDGAPTSPQALRKPSASPPTAIRRLSAGYPAAHFVTLLLEIMACIRCWWMIHWG